MAAVTADQLAEAIWLPGDQLVASGISWTGTWNEPHPQITQERLDRLYKSSSNLLWITWYAAWTKTSESDRKGTVTDFVARFLPRLAETFVRLGPDRGRSVPWSAIHMCNIYHQGFVCRFLRTSGEAGRDLALAALEALDHYELDLNTPSTLTPRNREEWEGLVHFCETALIVLAPDPPTSPLYPWISAGSHLFKRFDWLLDYIATVHRCEHPSDACGAFWRSFRRVVQPLDFIAEVLEDADPEVSGLNTLELLSTYQAIRPGVRCEGARKTQTPCDQPDEGMEFFRCGRCEAARYCGKAHQKADWKEHKILCVKPEW